MSQQLVITEEDKNTPIRAVISLIALLLGNILISIGAFLALGSAIGLIILGVLFLFDSVLFGLR